MKRICVFSYLFAPLLSAESMALLKKVRVLAERFALTIVTSESNNRVYPSDETLEKYIPQNVEVIRVPITATPHRLHHLAHTAGKILFRGSATVQYYDLCWARNAASFIRRKVAEGRKFDLLMTNSQHMCSHVAGHWAKPSLPVPWIQHYSDPVQHQATRKHYLPAQKLDDWFVPRILPQASLITVPSNEMKQSLYDAFDPAARSSFFEKTIVVPHTYDEQFLTDALKSHPRPEQYFGESDSVNVAYTGNLYGIRGAELVANVARRLTSGNAAKKIVIHVFGSVRGQDRKKLEGIGAAVQFHGNVSYLESLAVMQHADILLLLDVPVPGAPFFPSKLAEYLGTEKPIIVLASKNSAAARIASEMKLMLHPYTDEPIRLDNNGTGAGKGIRRVYSNSLENYCELVERMDSLG